MLETMPDSKRLPASRENERLSNLMFVDEENNIQLNVFKERRGTT